MTSIEPDIASPPLARKRREDLRLKAASFLPDISAGVVNGILIVIFQSAYAALIFSGELTPFYVRGIGVMLFGAFVLGLIVALFSSFYSTVTAPQDAPTAIMALVAANIVATLGIAAGDQIFWTVIAAMAITALTTGLALSLLGLFKWGNFIRFIPYPVIGGFLAGTGWILLVGAIRIMSGTNISLAEMPTLFAANIFPKWLPGVLFALILFFVMRRYRYFWLMPVMIFSAIGMFYTMLYMANVSTSQAIELGWLLPKFSGGISWQPFSASAFSQVSWQALAGESGRIVTIVFISVISLLLNASGMELVANQEIDLNRELRTAGLANIVAGFGGSSPGYMSLSLSALAYRMGARSRITVIVSALICGIVLVAGIGVSAYFPKFLLGGLLLYLGLSFLVEWLYKSWFKLPKGEYFLVVLIVVTIGFGGLLQGMILGTLIAGLLFVINYSRINVVKHTLSGVNFRSNVDRAAPYQRLLQEKGEQLLVLKLHGYIFCGTANNLLEEVRQKAAQKGEETLRFVVLDFYLVNGVDSSALNSFAKLKLFREAFRINIILTGLSPAIQRQFEASELLGKAGGFREFPDMDHGVEWCEDRILEREKLQNGFSTEMADAALLGSILNQSFVADNAKGQKIDHKTSVKIIQYMTHESFAKNAYLIRKDSPSNKLFLILSGQVTVQLNDTGKIVRLRSMGAGTVVGELGVYLGLPATASVIVTEACETLCLTAENLQKMEQESPQTAADFHKFITRILGERLINNNKSLRALMA